MLTIADTSEIFTGYNKTFNLNYIVKIIKNYEQFDNEL